MVIESNVLDFIFLKDGEQGEPGKPGESGKTLYTWIKYSQNADGSDMTDEPDGAIYVGFAYNKESETESTNPSDYSWTKIKGEDGKQGEDAYTIILSNENISFATNQSNVPLSGQSVDCEVTVMKGSSIVTDFIIGTIASVSGINISVLGRTITLSATSSTVIENDSGSIIIPITVDGYTFNKIISYSISKAGVDGKDGKTLYTWIRYADSPTSGISSSPDGKKYMGVAYNKTTPEPSDTYSDYKWSLIEGDGIASVETERVKNTDKTTAPTSGWGTDNVTWESGTYIWTRLKITYKSGTIEYTEPQVSSEWEAANQVQDNLDKEIEKVNSTISGVSSQVDQNTKSITDKVWQTDITNSINNYDNTTAEAIRERVTKTETDISGIKSSVSDIKSDVEKKADGTTVQTLSEKVSTMEQDAESFKTTVSNTYSTKTDTQNAINDIKIGARNLIRNAKTLNFTDYYFDETYRGELPAGYRRCKYIEGGASTYIRTGINVESTLEYTLDAILGVRTGWRAIVGGRESVSRNRYDIIYEGSSYMYVGCANDSIGVNIINFTSKYTMTRSQTLFSITDNSTLKESQFTITSGTPVNNIELTLFAQNTNGQITQYDNSRIYAFLAKIGGDIKRNFIPSLDTDGKPCMFDTVTKQPFYNSGNGEFGYELMDGTYVAPV